MHAHWSRRSESQHSDWSSPSRANRARDLLFEGSAVKRAGTRMRDYGVRGVPSMVVNGRYRVSSNQAVPGFEAMLTVVDYLVGRELAALSDQQGMESGAEQAAN